MWMILDEIVRGAQSDPGHADGGHVAFRPAALSLKMAILDKMPAWTEGLAVAACQFYTAVAGIEYVAAYNPVVGAAVHHNATVTDVADEATFDAVVRSAA